jgi:hypothetical protein
MEVLHEIKVYDAIPHASLRKLDDGAKRRRHAPFGQRNAWTAFNDCAANRHTTDAASDWACQSADGRHAANTAAARQSNYWDDTKFRKSDDTDGARRHALRSGTDYEFW